MRRCVVALSAVLVAAGLISSILVFLLPGASPAGAQDADASVSQGSINSGPGLPEEDFPPYSQVVDDADTERFSAPRWEARSTHPDGYKGDYHVAGAGAGPAQFKVEIPATDVYSVYAWWPTSAENSAAARFGVSTTAGVEWTEAVSQQEAGGMWVKLGEYEMAAGDSYIQVSPESGDGGRVVADAVAVVRGVLAAPPEDGTIDVAGGRPTGRDVVRVARRYIGTDYRWGTCTSRQMSCACLTKVVYAKFGQKLPFSEDKQWRYGRKVSPRKPGDLVFFKEKGRRGGITHVGIYAGNGELVHASAYFDRVVESKMRYVDGYIGARRLKLR